MNIQEMQLYFLMGLKSDYKIEFDIPTIQIEAFLNEAQRRLVEAYYSKFESDEKSRKVLSILVNNVDLTRTSVSATTTGLLPNGEYWELPTDCMYSLKEEATLNVNACEEITAVTGDYTRVYIKPINMDYYSKNIKNPFKKPYTDMVWRIDSSLGSTPQLHMLITGGTYRTQTYHLSYLSYPTVMSIASQTDCILPEMVHQDIVDEAIKIAMEVIKTNKLYKE